MPNDENVYRIITSRAPVVTGAEPTAPEWTDLQGRVGALEDDPKLLAALEDVDPEGPAGTVLVKQEDGTWKAGSVADPLQADTGSAATRFGPVTVLSFRDGLTVAQHPSFPSIAIVTPNIGTGSGTVAAGNHRHQVPVRLLEPISPGAYMSGGTRQLATRSFGLANGYEHTVSANLNFQIRGGDPGPCYYRLHLTINGNTRTSPAGTNGFWAVQGVPKDVKFTHGVNVTGTGAAITVSASISYYDGGGFHTDAGELEIWVYRNR